MASNDSGTGLTVVPAAAAGASSEQVFNSVRTGVFTVMSNAGHGLGFFADASGLVITAANVVAGDSLVTVQIDDNTRVRARVVARDSVRNAAVLAISRSRCARCPVLPLAGADSVTVPNPGDSIVAVGGVRPARQRMVRGTVTTADARTLRTSARVADGEAGAPIVSLGGAVLGMHGTGREISAADLRTVLSGAQRLPGGGTASAPSDSLLPVRPAMPFPAEPLQAVAASEGTDVMRRYLADGGNFDVFVMTPPLVAWRDARAKEVLARLKATPAGGTITADRIDPVQGWRGWDQCVSARCAMVLINVVPDRTPFLFHRLTGTVDFARANVRSVTLMRDGMRVEPVEVAYFPAVLNTAEYAAARKPVFQQGLVMYRAREFAPKPTGGMARYELVVVDATRPDRPVSIVIPPATVQAIINDFAPYGLAR
jgi:hypothetical protein